MSADAKDFTRLEHALRRLREALEELVTCSVATEPARADDQIENRDFWTGEAMRQQGGDFVNLLGQMVGRADWDNRQRIKRCWPLYWEQYRALGILLERKQCLNDTCAVALEVEKRQRTAAVQDAGA